METALRNALMALALAMSALVLAATSNASAQQQVTVERTASNTQVECVGAAALNGDGRLLSCVLLRNQVFSNTYGRYPSTWSENYPHCKGGVALQFDSVGNVQKCMLFEDVTVSNTYGAAPETWSLQFTCAANGMIGFDPQGHVVLCYSPRLQVINGVQCQTGAEIDVSGSGAVSCSGGAATPPAANGSNSPPSGGNAPPSGSQNTGVAEDPVSNVTWHACAYPNPAEGCGDWRFLSNGTVQGIVNGAVVWTGRWTRLGHYIYRYDFAYEGQSNHTWVRFSAPQGAGRATQLLAYPTADMTSPYRKGELSGSSIAPQPPSGKQPPAAVVSIAGTWSANDGGTYVIRQNGDRVTWTGTSGDGGRSWINDFQGQIQGDQIVGHFQDEPGHVQHSQGDLVLRIESSKRIVMVTPGGGFGGSVWTR
jgi:hypothetical protein